MPHATHKQTRRTLPTRDSSTTINPTDHIATRAPTTYLYFTNIQYSKSLRYNLVITPKSSNNLLHVHGSGRLV